MTNMNLAGNLQTLRLARNLNQKDLAEAVGVTEQAVSKWETGRNLPDLKTAVAVAAFLQVTLDELFLGKSDSSSEGPEKINDGGRSMEKWVNLGYTEDDGENRGYQMPATCAFGSMPSCYTYSSGSMCSFNTPPPSACGLFNSSACTNPFVSVEMCQALIANGICSLG